MKELNMSTSSLKKSNNSIAFNQLLATKEIFLERIKEKEMLEQKKLLDFYMKMLKELKE